MGYASGLKENERRPWIPSIHYHLLTSMRRLIDWAVQWNIAPAAQESKNTPPSAACMESRTLVLQACSQSPLVLTPALGDAITLLWTEDALVRAAYEQRHSHVHSEHWLMDGFEYWVQRLKTVMSEKYVPSVEDVLRLPAARPTPALEVEFHWDHVHCRVTAHSTDR